MDVIRRHLPRVEFVQSISCHHNYVAQEHHQGADVLVTRKGAIRAGRGELGIIPGSMGTLEFHRARARQPRVLRVRLARGRVDV